MIQREIDTEIRTKQKKQKRGVWSSELYNVPIEAAFHI